jgi:hypothetical protein
MPSSVTATTANCAIDQNHSEPGPTRTIGSLLTMLKSRPPYVATPASIEETARPAGHKATGREATGKR